MPQPDVKELEALIKMLRKHGVSEFEGHGLKMRIDGQDAKPKNGTASETFTPEQSFTEEELMMWSVGQTEGN